MSNFETFHILPVNDLRDHDENSDIVCWCNPSVETKGNQLLITHNSADGREYLESLCIRVGDIPNHLALVACHWLSCSDTEDMNVAIALKWLQKRHRYLTPTLGADESLPVSLVNYFDSFLKSLLDGEDDEDTRRTQEN